MTISFSPQGPGALTFAVGDVVRCIDTTGMPAKSPLAKGHIYTVRAIEGDEAAPAALRFSLVHLASIPGAYGAFRFAKVASSGPAVQADATAERMALVMRERERETGGCDIHDLARAGFTASEIIECADEARRLAGPPAGLVAA